MKSAKAEVERQARIAHDILARFLTIDGDLTNEHRNELRTAFEASRAALLMASKAVFPSVADLAAQTQASYDAALEAARAKAADTIKKATGK